MSVGPETPGPEGFEPTTSPSPPPPPRSPTLSLCLVIGGGLAYGLIARILFASEFLGALLGGAANLTFLCGVPFAMGALIAFLGMSLSRERNVPFWAMAAPCSALGIGLVLSILTGFEAIFCVLVAAPLLFFFTILGGLASALVAQRLKRGRTYLTTIVLLPYLLAPVERAIELPRRELTVSNRISIQAKPESVWREIASVPEIREDEQPWSWVHALGFPRPIAAVLKGEGVGALRVATFEREVSFFERVTEWQPGRTLAFEIDADPQFVPANAFDEHVIVGGRFYDVLDGRYRIEDHGGDHVTLHLSSRHRLNTHLGRYASWWSERIMSEIQGNILEVIRRRAEEDLK